ncbi:MAG: aspartate ammonia-lyase [Deltaproteobacteria bacterium]|nr:aspartate ammonia-lyase [Deltaproteobacteria bacterium]
MTKNASETRIEHDSLGEVPVPKNAYYGVQTQRGIENWKISGLKEPEVFTRAYVAIKRAAATVNESFGMLSKDKAEAIRKACDQVLKDKKHLDQFVIDVYQAGAGTSFNMNVNEVIANLAAEISGKPLGEYKFVHPNDDVNMAQSTNDSFPTAMRLSLLEEHKNLANVLSHAIATFRTQEKAMEHVLTSARTHLQDAVPISLGQEFGAFADTLEKDLQRLEFAKDGLAELNIGGTAAGTGMNSHPDYAAKMASELSSVTGIKVRAGKNLVELSQNMSDLSFYSGTLRNIALSLTKIANDLRLLSSGPTTGFNEIFLPATQPGSSIMPGKVNPSMLEMLNQVCFQVIGNDTAVSYSTQAGQLQLNVMMPVISYNMLMSQKILTNAVRICDDRCFAGIKPNEEQCSKYFEGSMGLATALNTVIGYEKAAKVVKQAMAEKKKITDLVVELGYLTKDEIKKYFSKNLTKPGFIQKK